MTNEEFTAELAERLDWTQSKVTKVLAQTVEHINSSLAENAIINIPNFGVFQTKKKVEKISVDSQTKERFLVPPNISVNFKPASILNEKYK